MYSKVFVIILSLIINFTYCAEFTVTSQIYMNIKQGKEKLGEIVIGLFGNDAPKTVKNFQHICLKGINGKTYSGTKFHRVIRKFMIQGGDIISNDGYGSISIYGKYFNDENLTISHKSPGYVGMANRGLNTNGCQFYITTISTPWLDGKHTIFGKVLKGQEIVHIIENVKTDSDDTPLIPVKITSCGEIPTPKPFQIDDESLYTFWSWIQATWFPLTTSLFILGIFHYFIRQLNMFC